VGTPSYYGVSCSAILDHPTMSTLEGSLKLIRELLEIEIPPQPSPPPRPAGGNFKLERGLAGLDQLLSQADADTRLLDNLSDDRLYGSTETLRGEGAR